MCKCNSFITRHKVNIIDTEVRMVLFGGRSPSQVLATNYCVCNCMCVRVTALSGIYYSRPSCYQDNYLPVNTADVAGHSKFHNVTQTILSPSVPETVSIRENKSHKYRRGWGANPWPLVLQPSAIATRPPWIDLLLRQLEDDFKQYPNRYNIYIPIYCNWKLKCAIQSNTKWVCSEHQLSTRASKLQPTSCMISKYQCIFYLDRLGEKLCTLFAEVVAHDVKALQRTVLLTRHKTSNE